MTPPRKAGLPRVTSKTKLVPVESFDELKRGLTVVAVCDDGHRHVAKLTSMNTDPAITREGVGVNYNATRCWRMGPRPKGKCCPGSLPVAIWEQSAWKGRLFTLPAVSR